MAANISPWILLRGEEPAHLFRASRSLCGMMWISFPSPAEGKFQKCEECRSVQQEEERDQSDAELSEVTGRPVGPDREDTASADTKPNDKVVEAAPEVPEGGPADEVSIKAPEAP